MIKKTKYKMFELIYHTCLVHFNMTKQNTVKGIEKNQDQIFDLMK